MDNLYSFHLILCICLSPKPDKHWCLGLSEPMRTRPKTVAAIFVTSKARMQSFRVESKKPVYLSACCAMLPRLQALLHIYQHHRHHAHYQPHQVTSKIYIQMVRCKVMISFSLINDNNTIHTISAGTGFVAHGRGPPLTLLISAI